MNPLSRGMKIVLMAQKQAAQKSGQDPSNDSHLMEPVIMPPRCSTPIEQEVEPETSLNEISYTELMPVTSEDLILNTDNDAIAESSSFSCYFPKAKSSILTQGNIVANTMLSLPNIDPMCTNESMNSGQTYTRDIVIPPETESNLQEETNTSMMAPETTPLDQQDVQLVASNGVTYSAKPMYTQEPINSCCQTYAIESQQNFLMPSGAGCSLESGTSSSTLARENAPESVLGIETEGNDGARNSAELNLDHQLIEAEMQNDALLPNERKSDETEMRPKKRKRADPTKWRKNINKDQRAKGQAYIGRKYEKDSSKYTFVERPAKELGERCECKTTGVRCSEISEERRAEINKDVWSISWSQREILVKSLVHRNNVGRHRVEQSQTSRQNTLRYHLNIGTGLAPVCKRMFINTTGLTQHFIRAQVCSNEESIPRKPTTSSKRDEVKAFLASLDYMPSHYCRKDSQKKYFNRSFDNKMDVFRVYKEWCGERGMEPASRQVVYDEMDLGNFAIFRPRKDQCDICVSHEVGNADEEKYNQHIVRKQQAQESKAKDKESAAASGGETKMLTIDLQAVLLAPSLKASALYYRQKLKVHNYTIFDTTSRDVYCYVWHEAEGGLTANEFASALCHYLSTNVDAPCKNVIIYSDGCTYQNRNSTLGKALMYTAQNLGITITQKYLEKGHTQMEVDSVHKTIEDKIKNKSIYIPLDYVRYMEEARQTPRPYRVEYVDHTFFKNYNNVCGLNDIRPGKKKGDPQVTDIRCLRYQPDGRILFKLMFEDDWEELMVRGNSTRIVSHPVELFQTQRKITAAKWKQLQEMKPVIPRDIHYFFDSLPHD